MGQPAAFVGAMHTCELVDGIVPHVGGPIDPPGIPTITINGEIAVGVENPVVCVGPPDMTAKGSTTVQFAGKPAVRMGDLTEHGGTIDLGIPTVMIGG